MGANRSVPRAARILLAATALQVGCAPGASPPDSGRLQVVVSVLPQAYFVERIGGELVEVRALIPPGASPGLFEPTFAEVETLASAALCVKVGHPRFPFESVWLESILRDSNVRVVSACDGIESRDDDPHVWLAPSHVRVMSANIASALTELLPERAETIAANLRSFEAEIDALDAELRLLFSGKSGGRFVVFHPAWGAFAEEYGLVQVAIEHDGKAPGVHGLSELVDEARALTVSTVFIEPQLDAAAARLVAEQVGARVETIDPLARDWSANLRRVGRLLSEALR